MKSSIACLAAAAALFALLPAAQAQSWQRSGMKQGYYAAYTGNAEVAGDEIKAGADDLDSLEFAKDVVAHMRNGRSLTIELPQLRLRDSFALNGAAQALGRCR